MTQDSATYFYHIDDQYSVLAVSDQAGRVVERTIGIWGDPQALGNGATYIGNNPWSGLDPFGLFCTGDAMLDDPEVRDKIQELIAHKDDQHAPFHDADTKHPEFNGVRVRESSLPIIKTDGGYDPGEITVSNSPYTTGDVRLPRGTVGFIHTHPTNRVTDRTPNLYHKPSHNDKNLAQIIDDTYIIGNKHMIRYDENGKILKTWDISDVMEDCNPCEANKP